MALFGSLSGGQKNVTSATTANNSVNGANNDNKIANQGGSVLASGGGALTNQAGAKISTQTISGGTVNQVDPGSYAFASHVVDAFTQLGAQLTPAPVGGGPLATVGAVAPPPSEGSYSAPSSSWKTWLLWGGGAVLALIVLAMALRRRA